jgi:hypothetical protein
VVLHGVRAHREAGWLDPGGALVIWYIQRKDGRNLETVDQFDTLRGWRRTPGAS